MRFDPPAVTRGIPIPPAPKRKKRSPRTYRPSPWIAWLQTLTVGDTFLTQYSEHITVKKYLVQLGIAYEYRWIPRQGGRFWITQTAPGHTFKPK